LRRIPSERLDAARKKLLPSDRIRYGEDPLDFHGVVLPVIGAQVFDGCDDPTGGEAIALLQIWLFL
jgi:hypothetical protein